MPANNDFFAVQQFWVVGPLHTRRGDLVCFVNGIPLVLIELKASHKSVEHAYTEQPARLPRHDPAAVLAQRVRHPARTGRRRRSARRYAPWEHFGEWKTHRRRGTRRRASSLETAIRGTCEPARLLDLVENFIAFIERPGGLMKVLAQNHQLLGVNAAIAGAARDRATRERQARGVLAHAGLRQEPVDAVLHAEGAAPRAGQLDVRDGHRPRANSTTSSTASSPTPAPSARGHVQRDVSRRHLRAAARARITATCSR